MTLGLFSRCSDEFAHLDEPLREGLSPLPGFELKTPEQVEGYAGGSGTLAKLWLYIQNARVVIHLVGGHLGHTPKGPRVAEFLAQEPAIAAWIESLQLDYRAWTYTQWEAWLGLYRRAQQPGSMDIFVCTPEGSAAADGASDVTPAASAHLAALRGVGSHPEIRFRDAHSLLVKLLTSDASALFHGSAQRLYEREFPQAPLIEHKREHIAGRKPRPAELLHARYGYVDFLDIDSNLSAMLDWVQGSGPDARVEPDGGRLIYGPAGRGKTRLAIELTARLRALGWTAGFLSLPPAEAGADRALLRKAALRQLLREGSAGLCLVIDYAETRQQELRDLAQAIPFGHAALNKDAVRPMPGTVEQGRRGGMVRPARWPPAHARGMAVGGPRSG